MGKARANKALEESLGRTHPRASLHVSSSNITGFWRLYEIDRLISQGQYPNCEFLAEHLEVHRRTVERDIERLRDFFGAPIVYDRQRKGYGYSASFSPPRLRLKEGEAVALFLGQKLLMQCKGTPLEGVVEKAMRKIRTLLPKEVDVSLGRAVEAVSFHVDPLRGQELEMVERYRVLVRAVDKRRVVDLKYYSASRGVVTCRRIEPYHLRLVDGAWYCIGFCQKRQEVRTFAVDRIRELSITEEVFQIPGTFSIEEYLSHSWIIERGTPTRVVIEFDASQSPYISGRQWHRSQKLRDLPSGGLEMTLITGSHGEIMRWVMSFGSHARVIEPNCLKQQILIELDKARRNYL